MFSSFKERLNTGLTTLQEKGLTTTTSGAADTPTASSSDNSGNNATGDSLEGPKEGVVESLQSSSSLMTSLSSPHSPTPSQGSFAPIASRIMGSTSTSFSSSLSSTSARFFRRPRLGNSGGSSVDLAENSENTGATVIATPASTSSTTSIPSSSAISNDHRTIHSVRSSTSSIRNIQNDIGNGSRLAVLVQRLTLNPQDEKPDPSELLRIREQQPAETELPDAVIEKLELLQRYEARFPDLAEAFRKIVQEKIAAEVVLKATTALEDLSDLEALEAHLQNMAYKNEMSMQEIRRLSEELRETIKTKDLEIASKDALISNLQRQLASKDEEDSADDNDFNSSSSIQRTEPSLGDETKVNSLDLSANISQSSAPSSPMSISLPPLLETHSTSSLDTLSPSISKDKKAKNPRKRDQAQALKELMVRLESVLKEKNEAVEEQEEAVEKQKRLQTQLEKEVVLNREMAQKMDRLQNTVAEMEERARREAATAAAALARVDDVKARTFDSIVDIKEGSATTTTADTNDLTVSMASQSPATLLGDSQVPTLQAQLLAIKQELEMALKKEFEAIQAKESAEAALAEARQAYDTIQESIAQTQKDLEAANAQVKELHDLAIALGEVKQDLVEAQEEVQEKQRLLDLERQWREEALKMRDGTNDDQQRLQRELNQAKEAKEVAVAAVVALRNELKTTKAARDVDLDTRMGLLMEEDSTLSTPVPFLPLSSSFSTEEMQTISLSNSTSENDIGTLEQLSSLKQERAELSEKLARLERLHQGFERSSSEKIRGLEQELRLLMEQKEALEAQVQEQSDLLIKEKEREKEMEQARVAEGIERVTLELAAVRTAERFASDKVTELAKDRDMVVEKVAKLEKRLERLKESKVGQEQSLTGQIEELSKEKQDLEARLQDLRTQFEAMQEKTDEEKRLLTEKQDALVKELDDANARLKEMESDRRDSMSDRIAGTDDEVSDKEKVLEEKLDGLKAELETKTKELELAQGEAHTQRTLHADMVIQLTKEIQGLTAERDSLLQSKNKLEQQLRDCQGQIEVLEQKIKIMEDENKQLLAAKTDAHQQMEELRLRIRALEAKEREQTEALALAKETIHQRDQDLLNANKSAQGSKSNDDKLLQKISKLEKEKLTLLGQLETAKADLSKVQQETKVKVAKLTSDQSIASQELQRLKATHVKILQERDQASSERDGLKQEKETNQKKVQMKQAELDTLQKMQENAETQMSEYKAQLMEARNRVDTLEELTSIAKRVAESKVVELETCKTRIDELEAALSNAQEQIQQKELEVKELAQKWKNDIEETRDILGEEISSLKERLEQGREELEALRKTEKDIRYEAESSAKQLEERFQTIKSLEAEMQEMTNSKLDLEKELERIKDAEAVLMKEKEAYEAAAEDFKIRENYFRNLNKTLKDEVRKLSKHLPNSPLPSPSSPYSPYSQGHVSSTPAGGTNATSGRAFSTPILSLTPPATPRFPRTQPVPDEDMNVEYLKNVLLSFMEHKERRQPLIPVLSQILKLSVEEKKRLAKVA